MRDRIRRWGRWAASREGRFVRVSLLLLVAGLVAFAVDDWACRQVYHFPWPSELHDLIMMSEVFAHGLGVLVIICVVAALETQPKWIVHRLAWCAFGAGLTANVCKVLIPRLRPHFADVSHGVWGTFGNMKLTELNDVWDYSLHSFPSAHTATAVGLAMGLSYCYPRGRYIFMALGVMAGLQRIVAGAHFLSDVLAGAAVGCLFAGLALRLIEQRHGALASRSPAFTPRVAAPERRCA